MKLYIYDHCPYCVRARMAAALKNISLETVILDNDDEDTPKNLIGKKAVPILITADGSPLPESLDIVRYLDRQDGRPLFDETVRPEVQAWFDRTNGYLSHLLHPRLVRLPLPEYRKQSAVDYFIRKKTESIGDFAQNLADTPTYLDRLHTDLAALLPLHLGGNRHFNAAGLSFEDILLFPLLRNMTCIKGLNMPEPLAAYTADMAGRCGIGLYHAHAC